MSYKFDGPVIYVNVHNFNFKHNNNNEVRKHFYSSYFPAAIEHLKKSILDGTNQSCYDIDNWIKKCVDKFEQNLKEGKYKPDKPIHKTKVKKLIKVLEEIREETGHDSILHLIDDYA